MESDQVPIKDAQELDSDATETLSEVETKL